jgi:hypothetical protein
MASTTRRTRVLTLQQGPPALTPTNTSITLLSIRLTCLTTSSATSFSPSVLALPSVPSPVPGPIAGGSLRAVAFSAGGDGGRRSPGNLQRNRSRATSLFYRLLLVTRHVHPNPGRAASSGQSWRGMRNCTSSLMIPPTAWEESHDV